MLANKRRVDQLERLGYMLPYVLQMKGYVDQLEHLGYMLPYVLQMKGYVDQLEHLGYMLPQDIIVGLILNGLTKDFAGFVRNYNMDNMGKTIGKLHVMFIEYEKGLLKKAETPQVMMIKGGKIQKANKKSLKAKGKGKANGKGNDKQVYIPKAKNPNLLLKSTQLRMTPATTARRWVVRRGIILSILLSF
ncbi:hypothetical protein Tco_0383371 [Tanacetum coccineum]